MTMGGELTIDNGLGSLRTIKSARIVDLKLRFRINFDFEYASRFNIDSSRGV